MSMRWGERHKGLRRMIAGAALFFFITTFVLSNAYAAVNVESVTYEKSSGAGLSYGLGQINVDNFLVPEHLGQVKQTFQGTSNKLVVHIQDAHCNYFAQQKISGIIEYLRAEYGISIVNLEGGTGAYDLDVFTSISGDEIRREVADHFVESGEINGAEFYAITNPEKIELWGVENKDLYLANLKAYRDSLIYKEEVDDHLKELNYILNNLKRHIYPPELLKIDIAYSAYKHGKMELKAYLKFLIEEAGKLSVDANGFSSIYLLFQAMELGDKIDFKKANMERNLVIEELKRRMSKNSLKELVSKVVEFKTKRMSQKAFYNYVLEKTRLLGIELEEFPVFFDFILYLKTYAEVDRYEVMEEMEEFESVIKESLYRNDTERRLSILSKNLALMKNVFDITLTKMDYLYYLENKNSFEMNNFVSFTKQEAPKYKITQGLNSNILNIDGYLAEIQKFYEYSFERDEAFVENLRFSTDYRPQTINDSLEEGGSKNEAAILVTGGFHTEYLFDLLEEEGISCVSILPKFTSEEGYVSPYFELLAGRTDEMRLRLANIMAQTTALHVPDILNPVLASAVYPLSVRDFFLAEVRMRELIASGKRVELVADQNFPIGTMPVGERTFGAEGGEVEKKAVTDFLQEAGCSLELGEKTASADKKDSAVKPAAWDVDSTIFVGLETGKAVFDFIQPENTIEILEIIKNLLGLELKANEIIKITVGTFGDARQKEIYKVNVFYRSGSEILEKPFILYAPAREGTYMAEESNLPQIYDIIQGDVIKSGGIYEKFVDVGFGSKRVPLIPAEFVDGDNLYDICLGKTEEKYSPEEIHVLQREAVRIITDIWYKSGKKKLFNDVALGQFVLDRKTRKVKLVDVGYVGNSSGRAIEVFKHFEYVFKKPIPGMELSLWGWTNHSDKTNFFHGIYDSLGKEGTVRFLTEIQASLKKDGNIFKQIEKYLNEGIELYTGSYPEKLTVDGDFNETWTSGEAYQVNTVMGKFWARTYSSDRGRKVTGYAFPTGSGTEVKTVYLEGENYLTTILGGGSANGMMNITFSTQESLDAGNRGEDISSIAVKIDEKTGFYRGMFGGEGVIEGFEQVSKAEAVIAPEAIREEGDTVKNIKAEREEHVFRSFARVAGAQDRVRAVVGISAEAAMEMLEIENEELIEIKGDLQKMFQEEISKNLGKKGFGQFGDGRQVIPFVIYADGGKTQKSYEDAMSDAQAGLNEKNRIILFAPQMENIKLANIAKTEYENERQENIVPVKVVPDAYNDAVTERYTDIMIRVVLARHLAAYLSGKDAESAFISIKQLLEQVSDNVINTIEDLFDVNNALRIKAIRFEEITEWRDMQEAIATSA